MDADSGVIAGGGNHPSLHGQHSLLSLIGFIAVLLQKLALRFPRG